MGGTVGRKRGVWSLLLCLLFCGPLLAGPLRLYTEEYPPLNFSRDGKPVGLSVEVVEELIRRTGDAASINLVPWARGLRETETKPDVGLFVTMRTEPREQRFQWVGPLLVSVTSFYGLRDSGLRIDSLHQAAEAGLIVVPRDWYSYEILRNAGLSNVQGVVGPQQMMQMLRRGRAKLIVAENTSLPGLLSLAQMRMEEVEPLHRFLDSYGYIAFSSQTDPALVARWQQALDGMRADGSFERIYRRWLPGQPLPERRPRLPHLQP